MHYVYILISESEKQTYTGCTKNLELRLVEHNSGHVKSSRPYRPYRVLYFEQLESLKEARQRERYFKSTSGRRKIKELIEKY